jgi:flagellin
MTSGGIDSALGMVENSLKALTAAGSQLGSLSSRIDLQTTFVSALTDSISSGVGKLVDANMEQESSKLTALQTQQQLAIQSLSIANSSAQNILSLFK